MNSKPTTSDPKDPIDAFLSALAAHSGPVAIGLDFAAQQKNWGLCALLVKPDFQSADLRLLLPHKTKLLPKKKQTDPDKFSRVIEKRTFDALQRTLAHVVNKGLSWSLAVDVPFGWPVQHAHFSRVWAADRGWDDKRKPMPCRKKFEFRLTDRAIRQKYKSKKVLPLAIGASWIASPAFQWALTRTELGESLGVFDFGLEPRSPKATTFETYPGAFVKLMMPKFGKYKTRPVVRGEFRKCIAEHYAISTTHPWLDAACQSKQSDAFDAFLCALIAWDHLRWKGGDSKIVFSTPTALLGREPNEKEKNTIRKEGWILVPVPRETQQHTKAKQK